MSRAAAVALLGDAGEQLPPVDTPLTWWTITVPLAAPSDEYLSAMDQLRDERWVYVSSTPVGGGPVPGWLVCLHRRLSEAEAAELRRPS